MNKKITVLGLAAVLAFAGAAMASCGGDNGGDNGGNTSKATTFEAEYTYLDDMHGVGYSGDISGAGVVQKDENNLGASNGYFVGWSWEEGYSIKFEFSSSEAAKAAISMRLANEWETNVSIDKNSFEVKVNGEVVSDYGTVALGKKFKDFKIGDEIDLKAGENTVELTVLANTLIGEGRTYGPMIDCIKVDAGSAKLTSVPYTENLEQFEE